MANYSIIVKDKNGDTLGEFTEWTDLRFSDRLNNYGEATFKVPVTSTQLRTLTSLRRYEVFITRNNAIVWAGEQVVRNGMLGANSANYVTITCRTYFEMLAARYTQPFRRFDQVDQGEILKTLVDESQANDNGDLGFTFGDYLTGTLRDREYSNYNIMEAYINMSNVLGGPDFYIDFNKEINIVPFKGIDKSAQTILEWKTNLQSVNIIEDFSSPANEAIILGSGFGSAQLIANVEDPTSQTTYKLRQQRVSEIDISSSDVLEAKGEAVLRKYKQPLLSLDIVQMPDSNPKFGTISLGDTITVRVREGIYNINNRFRVYGYNVNIGSNNKEVISYLVAQI